MRILIGTVNPANAIATMAHGFSALGHDVSTAAFGTNIYYTDTDQFDFLLPFGKDQKESQKTAPEIIAQISECLNAHEMFVFMASSSVYGRMQELPILRQMNKKIVVFCMGSEIRHKSVAQPFWQKYGYEFPETHYPEPSLEEKQKHPTMLSIYTNTFANKIHSMRIAEWHATAIFSDIPTSLLGLRPFYGAPFPFSHAECTFHISGRDIPHIVHAPTARAFKRTDIILAAVEELHAQGVAFTFELIEQRPNHEVLKALTNADILIDQIGSAGGHGRLSLEGMASGCAVVGCNNACVPYPAQCPIIKGNPSQLPDQLRLLCENRDLRIHLAALGRRWMLQELTSPRTIAQRMIDACENTLPPDYYPTAFMELSRAIEDEPMPRYLQEATLNVLQTYGCSAQADPMHLLKQGFLPPDCVPSLHSIPRWDTQSIHEVAPWAWCGKHIPPHTDTNTLEYHLRQLPKG